MPGTAHQVLGHLDGWGHGLHTGAEPPGVSRHARHDERRLGDLPRAWHRRLEVRVGACRAGFVTARITV